MNSIHRHFLVYKDIHPDYKFSNQGKKKLWTKLNHIDPENKSFHRTNNYETEKRTLEW